MLKTKQTKTPMTPYTVKVPPDLLERFKEKAGFIPHYVVARRLFERFVKGEIDLGIEKN